jgi:MFS family permease
MGITTIVSYGVSQYLIGVLVPPIAHDLGWDKAVINGAYSISVLVSGVLGFGVGRLVDRFGARALMSAGSALLGVSLLLLSRVQTIPQFYAIWGAGIGLGTALTCYPVSFTVVTNWFERRRMNALSLLTFFGAFASTIFYPLNGWLTAAFGWRDAVAVLGTVNLFVAVPLHALVVRRHPEDFGWLPDGDSVRREETFSEITGMRLSEALRTTAFWLITAAISLSFFATTTVIVEHIAFLVSRGLTLTLVTTIVGLWGIAYLPGRSIVAVFGGRVSLAGNSFRASSWAAVEGSLFMYSSALTCNCVSKPAALGRATRRMSMRRLCSAARRSPRNLLARASAQ